MHRIRFHGRGGQGMKTAANVLGAAFFAAGYEVQDAPRYGAERRGAPMSAYVRAAHAPIVERGIIADPDLVVLADPTLLGIPAAGVLQGARAGTVLLVACAEPAQSIEDAIGYPGSVLTLQAMDRSTELTQGPYLSAVCAGAAARLLGVVSREDLAHAFVAEMGARGPAVLAANLAQGLAAYDAMEAHQGVVAAAAPPAAAPEAWVVLTADDAGEAAPSVYAEANSELSNTGLWRSLRPVIDYAHCSRCSWICSTLCPDSAIRVDPDRTPRIDYGHCKGCMVCVAVCPPHAIHTEPEPRADAQGSTP